MIATTSIASLALAFLAPVGSGVHATPAPIVDNNDEVGVDTGDAVSFSTKDGILIQGSYWEPRSKKDRSPAAVLVHEAGKSRRELVDLAIYLNKKGFAVLTFDVRGHGESVTDKADWAAADEKAQETLWALAARDLDAAAEFILDRREVHSTNLSLVGVGAGCTLALRHAMDDENTRAVVLVSPTAQCLGTNVAGAIADLGGLPTLLVSSSKEKTIAKRLQAHGHEANGGLEYVEVAYVRSKPEEVATDKKLGSSTSSFLRDVVMEKK